MHDKLQEWYGFLASGSSAVAGWLLLANTYLQTLAFIVSITVGLLTVWSWIEKRKGNGTVDSGKRPKDS